MEAPDIIYTNGKNTCASAPVFSNIDGNVKYIRAELAELTPEDMQKIDDIMGEVWHEAKHGDLNENFYQEVLRRFLENKKEIEL